MKKNFLFLVIILVSAVVILSGCVQDTPPITPQCGNGTCETGETTTNCPADCRTIVQPPAQKQGTLLLAVKDAAPDISLLGSVELTVSLVSIHSNTGDSWIVLSEETKSFELLELQDVQAFLAGKDLNVGTYNQLWLDIEKVLVDYNGTVQEAKLPSNVLKLNVRIEIDENKISVAVLDFDLNKSLHVTGNGKIIMLPVIKIVSEKGTDVEVEGREVKIKEHGEEVDDTEIGTDIEGNNGEGKKVGHEKELEIDDNGKIKEKQPEGTGQGKPAEGRLVATIKDKKPLTIGKLSIAGLKELNITIDSITIHRPNSTDGNTKSWTEFFSGEKTWNLLALQDTEDLIADLNVAIGQFTQIRLSIKEATAVFDQNSDQNGASFVVKVPSGKLKLASKIIVDENKTSYVNLDFDLNKSLHVTGNDTIILKPVIRLVSKRNVQVQKQAGNKVKVENGTSEEASETEFDEEGNESS